MWSSGQHCSALHTMSLARCATDAVRSLLASELASLDVLHNVRAIGRQGEGSLACMAARVRCWAAGRTHPGSRDRRTCIPSASAAMGVHRSIAADPSPLTLMSSISAAQPSVCALLAPHSKVTSSRLQADRSRNSACHAPSEKQPASRPGVCGGPSCRQRRECSSSGGFTEGLVAKQHISATSSLDSPALRSYWCTHMHWAATGLRLRCLLYGMCMYSICCQVDKTLSEHRLTALLPVSSSRAC